MHLPILADIAIIFGLSIAALYICHKLHIPGIIGFLVTGVLAGSHGLGLIDAAQEVEVLAEIGVILLLFAIGIEFSLRSLMRIRRYVLLGGALQVVLTTLLTMGISAAFGLSLNTSIFLGFVVSLSSTAIVLKALQDRSEIVAPHGRTILAILIFQDIVIVMMMLVTPMLSEGSSSSLVDLGLTLGKGAAVVIVVLGLARYVVPRLLTAVAATHSRELFILTIVVICFTTAWVTSQFGLSLALGAFLAGLVISESEYSHQAFSNILPFRDIFTSLFFVSVGMLLDSSLFLDRFLPIIGITAGVIALKFGAASLAAFLLGLPLRVVLLTGLALCQIGEFSFILSKVGLEYELVTEETYGMILAVSVLTMAATPFIIKAGPSIAATVLKWNLPERIKTGMTPVAQRPEEESEPLQNHLVIVGYGLNGANVAKAAKLAKTRYAIIELNPELVRKARQTDEPIFYGDATNDGVLHHAGIAEARTAVIVISDPVATRRIIAVIRAINPLIHIIARTRFVSEMDELFRLGANEVITEEYETSIEIFARVLQTYGLPYEDISAFVDEVRSEGYEMLRGHNVQANTAQLHLDLPSMMVESFRVESDSTAVGHTLAELDIRKRFGATVLAIRRKGEALPNPDPNSRLEPDDVVMILGTVSQLRDASAILNDAHSHEEES